MFCSENFVFNITLKVISFILPQASSTVLKLQIKITEHPRHMRAAPLLAPPNLSRNATIGQNSLGKF